MMCHKRLGEDKPLALVLWSSIHCNTLKENQKVYSLKLENINQNIEKSFPRDDQRIPSAIRSTMPVTLSRGACITCSKKCSKHHKVFVFLATVGYTLVDGEEDDILHLNCHNTPWHLSQVSKQKQHVDKSVEDVNSNISAKDKTV